MLGEKVKHLAGWVTQGLSPEEAGLIDLVLADVSRLGYGLSNIGEGDGEGGVLVELDKDNDFFVNEIESGVDFDLLGGLHSTDLIHLKHLLLTNQSLLYFKLEIDVFSSQQISKLVIMHLLWRTPSAVP